jgi:murein DD-endopeptidase MepM/ murein hydrolase activator NlpD
LKPEFMLQSKLVRSASTDRDTVENKVSTASHNRQTGFAKIAFMFGLAAAIGISSLPTDRFDTTATASESDALASSPADYVDRLRQDVAAMQAQHGTQPSVLVAQAFAPRSLPQSVANRTDPNIQFNGEPAVQIEVGAPKNKTFKPIATAQPYPNTEGDLDREDRFPSAGTGETTIGFTWPAAGKLTSKFGRRWGRMHKGIDIAGPVGTPIEAAADGTVIAAGWHSGGYGNLVEIRHIDGTTTRYGHNSRLSVSVGQTVRQGQQVAEMGSTGNSTGSHLHFEIRPSGGSAVNPMAHLPANG